MGSKEGSSVGSAILAWSSKFSMRRCCSELKVTTPIDCTLEYGVEFVEDDELVEITPKSIRLRKRYLKEHERKKASRETA